MTLAFVSDNRLPPMNATPIPTSEIHLNEEQFVVQLEKGGGGSTQGILNTGTTNHMMRERMAFSKLDTVVCETVRFGDGSMVSIKGHDIVLSRCKSGKHQVLAGVYFIPG
jgi:hypothetical protein